MGDYDLDKTMQRQMLELDNRTHDSQHDGVPTYDGPLGRSVGTVPFELIEWYIRISMSDLTREASLNRSSAVCWFMMHFKVFRTPSLLD